MRHLSRLRGNRRHQVSQWTPCRRKLDSNHRPLAIATMVFARTLRPDAFRERDQAPEARPTTARAEIASAESQKCIRPDDVAAPRASLPTAPLALARTPAETAASRRRKANS